MRGSALRRCRKGQILMPGPVDPKRLLYREFAEGALAEAQGLMMAAHRYAG